MLLLFLKRYFQKLQTANFQQTGGKEGRKRAGGRRNISKRGPNSGWPASKGRRGWGCPSTQLREALSGCLLPHRSGWGPYHPLRQDVGKNHQHITQLFTNETSLEKFSRIFHLLISFQSLALLMIRVSAENKPPLSTIHVLLFFCCCLFSK